MCNPMYCPGSPTESPVSFSLPVQCPPFALREPCVSFEVPLPSLSVGCALSLLLRNGTSFCLALSVWRISQGGTVLAKDEGDECYAYWRYNGSRSCVVRSRLSFAYVRVLASQPFPLSANTCIFRNRAVYLISVGCAMETIISTYVQS